MTQKKEYDPNAKRQTKRSEVGGQECRCPFCDILCADVQTRDTHSRFCDKMGVARKHAKHSDLEKQLWEKQQAREQVTT